MRGWYGKKDFYQRARYIYGRTYAGSIVNRAVKKGDILPAKKFDCVDCGKPAKAYDHRDYNKPLDIDPVCSRCNKLRGSAIGMKPLPRGSGKRVKQISESLKKERDLKIRRHFERCYGNI